MFSREIALFPNMFGRDQNCCLLIMLKDAYQNVEKLRKFG